MPIITPPADGVQTSSIWPPDVASDRAPRQLPANQDRSVSFGVGPGTNPEAGSAKSDKDKMRVATKVIKSSFNRDDE